MTYLNKNFKLAVTWEAHGKHMGSTWEAHGKHQYLPNYYLQDYYYLLQAQSLRFLCNMFEDTDDLKCDLGYVTMDIVNK